MTNGIDDHSLSLAPGTKVRLNAKEMEIVKGFIMLGPSDISVLGGRVEKLAYKWELTQVPVQLLCYRLCLMDEFHRDWQNIHDRLMVKVLLHLYRLGRYGYCMIELVVTHF